MPLYRLPAIVLRTYPFQETHFIVTLFSPTKGKIRAIAKGCRRLQSSLGRAVQPMVQAVFLLAEGKNLDVITQGEIKSVFPKTRENLERLAHGLYAMELIDRFVEEPEPQPNLYFLLLKTLEALETSDAPPPLLRGFEANLLRLLGYAPRLDACVQCERAGSPARFSARLGGILCGLCPDADKQAAPLDAGTLTALRACFDATIGEPPAIAADSLRPVTGIFQRFMEEKCGKSVHSFRLLQEVDHLIRGI